MALSGPYAREDKTHGPAGLIARPTVGIPARFTWDRYRHGHNIALRRAALGETTSDSHLAAALAAVRGSVVSIWVAGGCRRFLKALSVARNMGARFDGLTP